MKSIDMIFGFYIVLSFKMKFGTIMMAFIEILIFVAIIYMT